MTRGSGQRAGGRQRTERAAWRSMNLILLLLVVAVTAYLLYALIRPEKF